MAVAAYASVLSLLRVLGNIQHPSHLRLFPDPTQIDALREKLCFLQDLLEVHSSAITEDTEFILRKITRVTFDAEILINNYVVEQLYRELENVQNDVAGFCDIDTIHDMIHLLIQEIAPINEALTRTTQVDHEQPILLNKNKLQNKDHSLTSSGEKNKMVGFDDRLNHVLGKLTGNQPNLIIVPIVGMGGIGKTTLARTLFDHPYNLNHFEVRIWLTISQDYSVKNVLLGLLEDGVIDDDKYREFGDESEAELITKLYQKLYGQRYLIVLDDVWSEEAWHDLRRSFPENGKRSRVMVTTRLYDIANSLDSHNNNTYSMELLDEDKSWELFSEVAFQRGGRSLELQEIGRKISKCCSGLPLLLVVFAGLLANSEMTVEYWQSIAEDINSFASSVNDEYCLKVLSLSYHNLPIHLKACFLYTRHFKEDSKIVVSELIESLVFEGLVKPVRGKTLEEAARKYIDDLIGRNMLLIHARGYDGSIEICGIHDLLRDWSIKESNREQFLELPKTISVRGLNMKVVCAICKERKMDTVSLNPEILGFESDGIMLVCGSCESVFPEFPMSPFVMAVKINSQNFTLPTTCRWILLYHSGHSFSSTLRLFWNLEFLQVIGGRVVVLPEELWEMPQLRHVRAGKFKLPDPSSHIIVLENLQTLKTVVQFKCTEEIVRRIPNLRDLDLLYDGILAEEEEEEDWSSFHLRNLAHLQKLESLTITCYSMVSMDLKKGIISFPCSLKELTLWNCGIAWDDLTIIGSSLPDLQALRLLYYSVIGEEWNPIEGEFLRLKYLRLEILDLVQWRVDHETHFPALETLVLDDMKALDEIHGEIGELPSLKSIYLKNCDERIVDSARAVVEEQHSNGNEGLLLHVEDY